MKTLVLSLTGAYLNTLAYLSPRYAARFGFELFCRPFRPAIKEHQMQFLNSAELFTFENAGVTIQGYRWGNGEKKILFVHGWQSHTFRWKNYIESLSKEEYTIYSIDAPGHGLSGGNYLNVPFYSAVIRQFIASIGSVDCLVSHSLGSFSALYALHEDKLLPVKKLVLLAPPGEASDFLALYRQKLNLSNRSFDLILNYFEEKFQKPISYFSTVRFATDLSIPGLIIHDEEDAETLYECSKHINEKWPQSRLIKTKGLGHNLKSADVVEATVNFITESDTIPVL